MKATLIAISILLVAFLARLVILAISSKGGEAPGLVDGRLAKCPDRPNCVCSEDKEDSSHYIAPLILPQDTTFDTLPFLKEVIHEMGGRIRAENAAYLASTFSTAVFGFVDDLEIRIDSDQGAIHIRSASRVGNSDLGVNNRRVESLKKRYLNKVAGGKAGKN